MASSLAQTTGSQPAVEIGRLWLHLPTGSAAISGFVRGQRGGPEVGGVINRHQPVHKGGHQKLFKGLDPMPLYAGQGVIVDLRYEKPRFDNHGFNWAHRSTSDVQAEAERHGWRTVTRAEAADALLALGYTLHEREEPDGTRNFHDGLWLDQADGLRWHVRESIDRTRFVSERSVFVIRDITPSDPPELTVVPAPPSPTRRTA